jgi:1L-myo-inositol 1-phosphate cytidylyltransferase / CDP-L-myo-inositol myo-inositolphosphotransferase
VRCCSPGRNAFGFTTAATNGALARLDAAFEGADGSLRVIGGGMQRAELEAQRREGAIAPGVHGAGERAFERVSIARPGRVARLDLRRWAHVLTGPRAHEHVVEDAAGDAFEAAEIVSPHLEHAPARPRLVGVEIEHDDDVAPFAYHHEVGRPRESFLEHQPRRHVGELTASENVLTGSELETITDRVERGHIGGLGVRGGPDGVGSGRARELDARRCEEPGGSFGMAYVAGHAYLLAPATIMTNYEGITTPAAVAEFKRDDGWVLVLDAPQVDQSSDANADPLAPWFVHRLLGLSVALRLALTAQAAGARAIALSSGDEREAIRRALVDDRLKIGVYDIDDQVLVERQSPAPAIRVPANLVVHRAVFAAVAARSQTEEVVYAAGDSATSTLWHTAHEAAGPYGFAPIAVADRASFDGAVRALLRSLRKPQDGWTSTYLNRPISLAITRRLVGTSLRPNQVSVAILAVGLTGAFLASRGTYTSLVAGAALFHAQSVLDGCDGEMSRLTFRGSRLGEWLDTIGDDLTNYGFFGGAAWGLYATTGRLFYLALGGLTVFSGLLGSGIEYRYLVKIGSGDLLKYPLGIGKAPSSEASAAPKSRLAKTADAIAPLFKRDTFVFLTLLGAVAGALGPLLAIFAVGAMGVLVAVLKAELRMAGERASKGRLERRAPRTRLG